MAVTQSLVTLPSNPPASDELKQLQYRLRIANLILLASVVFAALAITIGFVLEQYINLAWQVTAHITILLCSITLKVGYLLRSFSLKRLGRHDF